MKRYIFRLSIALLTFLIGIVLTSTHLFFTKLPNVEVDYELANVFFKKGEPKEIIGEIEVRYAWSLMGVDSLDGQFKVINKTNNTIYYWGYGKNSHIDNWIRQNGEVKSLDDFYCLNGLKQQELAPNESAVFSIAVPQNKKPFEAGFAFKIGDEQKEETVWVKVNKQLKSYDINCQNKMVKPNSILAETCISNISK